MPRTFGWCGTQPEETVEEGAQPGNHPTFLLVVTAARSKARNRRQDLGDGRPGGAQLAVAEGVLDELLSGLRLEVLIRDDPGELGLALGLDEGHPFVVDVPVNRNRVDEGLDEVPLVTQRRAGVDRPGDLGADLFVVAVAVLVPVLLHQHEDVIDVDFHLFDEFDLEENVVVDYFLLGVLALTELGVEVEVDAAVVLPLAFAEDLVPGEVVE